MHRLVLLLRRALDALWRGPFVSAVAVGTIFVAVLLIGSFAAVFTGAERLLSAWSRDVPISVYLAAGADLEQARAELEELAAWADDTRRELDERLAALPLLQQGNAFIAIGAMHLLGKEGLVELFRTAGYTVTPVE